MENTHLIYVIHRHSNFCMIKGLKKRRIFLMFDPLFVILKILLFLLKRNFYNIYSTFIFWHLYNSVPLNIKSFWKLLLLMTSRNFWQWFPLFKLFSSLVWVLLSLNYWSPYPKVINVIYGRLLNLNLLGLKVLRSLND